MLLDATNVILGRLATEAAKRALKGEKITIINAEKAVITGEKRGIIAKAIARKQRGQPTQGPFIQTRPQLYMRRTIRGMLPYKTTHGKEALARVQCFVGVPEQWAKDKAEQPQQGKVKSNTKHLQLAVLCSALKAREK